ncbi:hypothetical protein [Lentilactobacillus kosonis]|uniref:Uncharacterized protein n=1 Tax=Lentilactobacillus kosonis TaxID=2810561 RepID=A0A401FLB2_9LACO|nr:hypothetical protein [Lentilactobacillus kosonis]GAY73165.1 hypothetical protein NBRC111893_1311 [Lentilactobacillus kosonis]
MTPQEVKKQKLTDIFYALMELGRDKPIMDIGVAELCRNAKYQGHTTTNALAHLNKLLPIMSS